MKNTWLEMSENRETKEKYERREVALNKMVEGINGPMRNEVRKLINNQVEFIERMESKDLLMDTFQRLSIQLARRIFDPENFEIADLISIQALEQPCGKIQNTQLRYVSSEEPSKEPPIEETNLLSKAAVTKMLRTKFPLFRCAGKGDWVRYMDCPDIYLTPEFYQHRGDIYSQLGIDNECDMIEYLTHSLVNEITAEIINDIRNNVGTVSIISLSEKRGWSHPQNQDELDALYVLGAVLEMASIIHKKTLFCGNRRWIVASINTSKKYFGLRNSAKFDKSKMNFGYCHWYGEHQIYCDKNMPDNEILVGNNDTKSYKNGYIYSPYVPLGILTPMCLECRGPDAVHTDEHENRLGLITRYAKCLPTGGAKFFGKIKIEA